MIVAAQNNNTYVYSSQRLNSNGQSARITGGTKDFAHDAVV